MSSDSNFDFKIFTEIIVFINEVNNNTQEDKDHNFIIRLQNMLNMSLKLFGLFFTAIIVIALSGITATKTLFICFLMVGLMISAVASARYYIKIKRNDPYL